MKLQVFSDLHVEFEPFEAPQSDADVVILAGDIHVGKHGLKWALEAYPDTPVVYVFGNHEYYGGVMPNLYDKLKEEAQGTRVHILNNEAVAIAGVRFLGCTLWTDFNLFGDPAWAGFHAEQSMADYRKIRLAPNFRRLRSDDTAALHRASLRWLDETLGQDWDGPTVVVSHHAPSQRSIPAFYANDSLSPGYASALDNFVEDRAIDVWVHGHTHEACDYQIGATRVVCNPRGYPNEGVTGFDPGFMIEL